MPAFSGLYDGIFHTPYALNLSPRAPMPAVLRVLLQKRGMYSFVKGFGRKAPATRKQVDSDRNSMIVRGGWTYAGRIDDVANRVTIQHIGGDVNLLENKATVGVATANDMKDVADTILVSGWVADSAGTGATAPAYAESIAP